MILTLTPRFYIYSGLVSYPAAKDGIQFQQQQQLVLTKENKLKDIVYVAGLCIKLPLILLTAKIS